MISKSGRHQILVVEDNRADVFLLREAIVSAEVAADLHVVTDGEMAVGFIQRVEGDESASRPSLVILDLNLPKKTGCEVLEFLRRSKKCGPTRVLIVTSSNSDRDKADTARLGANGYFRKPSGYDAFMKIGEIIRAMLASDLPESGISAV